MHISYPALRDCKRPDLSYGEICVKCNECHRWDREYECSICGTVELGTAFCHPREGWCWYPKNGDICDPQEICPNCLIFFQIKSRYDGQVLVPRQEIPND